MTNQYEQKRGTLKRYISVAAFCGALALSAGSIPFVSDASDDKKGQNTYALVQEAAKPVLMIETAKEESSVDSAYEEYGIQMRVDESGDMLYSMDGGNTWSNETPAKAGRDRVAMDAEWVEVDVEDV